MPSLLYLNKVGKRRSFDIIELCGQDEASSGDAFPVWLIHNNFQDQLLEVGVGHWQGQEVETTFGHTDTSHLTFDAEKTSNDIIAGNGRI